MLSAQVSGLLVVLSEDYWSKNLQDTPVKDSENNLYDVSGYYDAKQGKQLFWFKRKMKVTNLAEDSPILE